MCAASSAGIARSAVTAQATICIENSQAERSLTQPRYDDLRASLPLPVGGFGHPLQPLTRRRRSLQAFAPQPPSVARLQIDDRPRQVLRMEAGGDIDPGVGFEHDAFADRHTPDEVTEADRPPCEPPQSVNELRFVADTVRRPEDLPGAPDRQRRVAREQPEPSDLTDR